MSEQSGGTHGQRQDDARKHETRGEVQTNRSVGIEEWREPEPPGEDQPDATWAPGRRGRPEALAHGRDPDSVQLRSDFARMLGRDAFPATRDSLLAELNAHNAPQSLHDLAAALPADREYGSLPSVFDALGIPTEPRRADRGAGR